MEHGGCIYIITNHSNTTLYVGVTSDLYSRIVDHKVKRDPASFSAKYDLRKLVYYEVYGSIEEAIDREKQLKGGSRKRKVDLISQMNPEWEDLFEEVSQW